MIPDKDRFRGCLIGQCLGDALGFMVEGEPPTVCDHYVREVIRPHRVPRLPHDGFSFGQYSDASQMTRELMESLMVCSGFDPRDYAQRLTELFAQDRVVGRGHTMTQAIERLAAGMSWDQAGIPAPAAGNGSAIRVAPIGLFYGDDIPAMLRHAHDQGRITHADPRCSAGAATIAGAVALVSRGHPADPEMLLDKLQGYASRFDPTFAANLRQLRDWVRLPPEPAACGICSAGLPPGVDSQWCGGISAFVVASVLWALYAFLRNPDNYGEAIATAILPGGDTDTAAAMAGALSGARLGLSAIPGELMSSLNDRGAWKTEDLVVLADACWQVAQ